MSGRKFTVEEKIYIEENYSKKALKVIASDLNRTVNSLVKYCYRERKLSGGIKFNESARFYMRDWNEDEKQYVFDHIGIVSLKDMAKCLNRTVGAVEEFAQKNKLRLYDNFISTVQLGRELNKAHSIIRKYVKKGWLKGKIAPFDYVFGKSPIMLFEEDIVRFLKGYYYLFNPSKIDNPYYRNIVRAAYKSNHGMIYESNRKFTISDKHFPPNKLIFSY